MLLKKKIQTRDCRTVGFVFTDLIEGPPATYGVLSCQWPFRFAEYTAASKFDKKRMILDALHAAMQWICEKEGWMSNRLNLFPSKC
jgi:hypothetical protein